MYELIRKNILDREGSEDGGDGGEGVTRTGGVRRDSGFGV